MNGDDTRQAAALARHIKAVPECDPTAKQPEPETEAGS